jgi:hypothetical protein
LNTYSGTSLGSTSARNSRPDPNAAGSIRSASVALNGFVLTGELRPVMFVWVFARMTSSASPTFAGRSMHTVVVSRKSAEMPYSRLSVAWMTSFWTSPYSETAISWRVSSWRTSISGSCSAS